jgi:ABC-type multidrug transport system permease subunit
MSWITESNRQYHFLYAIPIGLIFSILAVLGCAFGMEFKDKQYGNKFDWLDIAATMLGGLIG